METQQQPSSWPYGPLFWFGFFGTDEPAGRRLLWRTAAALIAFIAAGIYLQAAAPGPALTVLAGLILPGSVLFIAWAYVRYLASLDELRRQIQLEAFALSYGAAFVLLMGLYALEASAGISVSLLWLVLAEPLRGVALVLVARRYR